MYRDADVEVMELNAGLKHEGEGVSVGRSFALSHPPEQDKGFSVRVSLRVPFEDDVPENRIAMSDGGEPLDGFFRTVEIKESGDDLGREASAPREPVDDALCR